MAAQPGSRLRPASRAAQSVATPADRKSSRWVTAELDVEGTIDDHATMCLRHAILGEQPVAVRTILVDMRDLAVIGERALGELVQASDDCRRNGVRLVLVLSCDERQDAIAAAFDRAGLAHVQPTADPRGREPDGRSAVHAVSARLAGRTTGRARRRCSAPVSPVRGT